MSLNVMSLKDLRFLPIDPQSHSIFIVCGSSRGWPMWSTPIVSLQTDINCVILPSGPAGGPWGEDKGPGGRPVSGAGHHSPPPGREGPRNGRDEAADAAAAGRVPGAAGYQAGSGYGDLCLQEAAGGRGAEVCSPWAHNELIQHIKSDTQSIITILFVSAGCVSPPAPRPSKWQQVAPPRQLTLDRSTTAARTLPPRGAALTTPTARPPASQVEPWPALASPSRPQPADGSPWTRWTWRGSMSDWATKQMRWEDE